MTTRMRRLAILLAALAVVTIFPTGTVRAQSDDETEGEFTFGPQYLMEDQAQDSAKFLEYRDVPNGFWSERFRFTWRPSSRSYLDLDVRDIVQTDQIIHARFGKTDLWKISIDWVENPRRWTDRAETLFADQGDAVFTLPDAFQSAVQAGTANADTTPADGFWDAGTKGAIVKDAIAMGAQDVFLGHQRRTGTIGFELTPTRSWTLGASVARERRSGTAPQSLGFYFSQSPAEVAAPVDFRTDWASVRAEYSREKFNIGGELIASKFETGYDSLTWDNQLILNDTALSATLTSNPGRGRLNLGTNNDMAQAILFGGVNLPGRTRVDVTLSRGEVTQDDPFLPMTINGVLSPLVTSPLPAASLDGKHTNTFANLRIASRPSKTWRWSAWYRDQELENENPRLLFPEYVQTDYAIPYCSNPNSCDTNGDMVANTLDRIQRQNLPLSYDKSNTGALIGWSPVRWIDTSLSYEIETIDREHAAVEKSDEDIVTLRLDFPVADWLMLRATAKYQERRADDYEVHYYEESFPIGEPYVAAFNEGLRRHIWTDRDRTSYGLMFEVSPHPTWSIYGEASYSDDDYLDPVTGQDVGTSFTTIEDRNFDTIPDAPYTLLLAGRTHDKLYAYTVGVALNPSARFNLYADYTWETSEYGMASRYRAPFPASDPLFPNVGTDNPLDDWASDAEDRYYTYSFGFDATLNAKKTWRLNADVSRSEGKGDLDTTFVPGGAASGNTTLTSFPQVDTRLAIARLALTHAIRPNLDYSIRWWYERWQEDNWASDFMQPYMGDPTNDPGSATAIYLGMDYLNYSNHILSLLLRYRY